MKKNTINSIVKELFLIDESIFINFNLRVFQSQVSKSCQVTTLELFYRISIR